MENLINVPFWVVTKPTGRSELGDICFKANFKSLRLQFFRRP